jgi:ABC-2 type transport system ATP-binding protein
MATETAKTQEHSGDTEFVALPDEAPPRPDAMVETRGLSKLYGRFVALADLNMVIERGSIYGFIGPNGAGKTTTMRILATLLAPSAGRAWVAGHRVDKEAKAVRQAIGYMPDFFGVYDNMKVWEYLDFFAAAYKVPPARRKGMIDDLLSLVDLSAKRAAYVDSLSRGMKQRLGVARTLVHDPELLILDEPASGLDPRARIELRELLKALRGMGKTILISSHILTELAEVCTHVGIIERGRLLASGAINQIMQRLQPTRVLRVGLLSDPAAATAALEGVEGVLDVTPEETAAGHAGATLRVRVNGGEQLMSELLAHLLAAGVLVYAFAEEQSDLEDLFLRVTQGLVA